jgi:hypothetical protein
MDLHLVRKFSDKFLSENFDQSKSACNLCTDKKVCKNFGQNSHVYIQATKNFKAIIHISCFPGQATCRGVKFYTPLQNYIHLHSHFPHLYLTLSKFRPKLINEIKSRSSASGSALRRRTSPSCCSSSATSPPRSLKSSGFRARRNSRWTT